MNRLVFALGGFHYSFAYAIPIAVFDAGRIGGMLKALPSAGEIIFTNGRSRVHDRRWIQPNFATAFGVRIAKLMIVTKSWK
ncbi:hypothetical protein [Rhizobium sp.]|uniref:hypothetical protein n=1 Tax=Rhizobium sp. TaxID=391 RepID=UPI002AA618CF